MLLRTLQAADRPATGDERQVLAGWSGWGALPQIFNNRPARPAFDSDGDHEKILARWEAFSDVRERVRGLLSRAEWDSASRNTVTAFYTDPAMVRAVWATVRDLGFDGGTVLEPGSGSGNFIGQAPKDTTVPVMMFGVELDPVTADLSRRLHPDAEVLTSKLEDARLPKAHFAASVGNVPFGSFRPFDAEISPKRTLSIHDLAVLKALTTVRPGGIVAHVTSRYTLDAENDHARRRMYELGDLLGAVRLPARAHAAAAGTDVVTDVVFLRRRLPGEEPGDAGWLTSVEQVLPGRDEPVHVNAHFAEHPERVLGELRTRLGRFGPEVTVIGPADRVGEQLRDAGRAITESARTQGLTGPAQAVTQTQRVRAPYDVPEGALRVDDAGTVTIAEDGYFVPLDVHPEQRDKLVQLIRIKEQTRALYDAEAASSGRGETDELAALRADLRTSYRAYRKKNPSLAKPRQTRTFTPKGSEERARAQGLQKVPDHWRRPTAFGLIDDDPEASLTFGLEVWDEATKRATEQKVLHARVLEPRLLRQHADSPEEAVTLALEHDGGDLHLSRVAQLLGADEPTAIQRIGHLAFRDPDKNGAWEPRHRYLSGDVRHKLQAAKAAAADDPSYAGNVAALEQVQPELLTPSQIKAKLGATWVPVEVYDDFLAHLGFDDAHVAHAGGTVWEVKGARHGDLARTEWGTGARSAGRLMEALLRQTESTIRVTWRDDEGRTHVDQEATDAAREKARLIAEAFEDWVWSDPSRAKQLAGIYNERFNNLVMTEHDTAPLTLPGVITDWKMRPHQNAAIRRVLSEPTALLAHVVGAGKTATMVAAAMELRRTGLASKPAIVVPNHMLKQFGREFRQLYPKANLLAISASDLGVTRRAKFLGRMAGGGWDAVILTHEAFVRMPLRPQTIQHYMDTEISMLREQIEMAAEAGMDSRTVKQIETSLANAEGRLAQQLLAAADYGGVTFEDTGADYLFFDESHEFKNLRTISAIPGAEIEGSAKATKLHMVLSHLREHTGSGRVATLATGTPIANSVTEAYVLMRYLAPDLLERLDLDAFDNWAATFGEVVSALEPDPKGGGYRYKARFARFFNVPELMVGYRTFADVRMAEDLNLPTPTVRGENEDQRGETVLIPATGAQRDFIRELKNQPWINKPGGILKALGEGLRASLDMRLVGGMEEQGSKMSYAAEKIVEIWQDTKDTVYPLSKDDPTPQETPGSLQLVFLDEGTPGSNARHEMNLYGDLRDKLVDQGIPREQIRLIHEAHTDKKKDALFADCRSGKVAVLIGSTQKMGTGTNVQSRAVALHHLSYPWRPADMAQRDGRIERQGNLNTPEITGTPDDVRILYYVTERTFDEFRLNTLARKAKFIGQIQRRNFAEREIEDVGAEAMNLGMLTALASGDPAVLKHAEAAAERVRLTGLARDWDRAQDARAAQISAVDSFIERAEPALAAMRDALPRRRPTTGDAFTMRIGDRNYGKKEDAAAALGTRMTELARDQSLRPRQRVPVGTLGGLDFHAEISFDHKGSRQLKLRFPWGHVVPDGHRDDRALWPTARITEDNGRGAVQALENFLNRLDGDIGALEKELTRQLARRDGITGNLQGRDGNPYRELGRSKEREERVLGKLIIANEKESGLAERASTMGERADEESQGKLEALRADISELKRLVDLEHEMQEVLHEATRRTPPDAGPARDDSNDPPDAERPVRKIPAPADDISEAQAGRDPAAPPPPRRRTKVLQPATPPGPGQEARTGVYGRAEAGDCDRCGEESADRYVMAWHWTNPDEGRGDMAAECAPCVEITAGVPADQAGTLADLADTLRGSRVEMPERRPSNDVTLTRTAPNEWTSVHQPTGQRYRTAQENESSHRGFVTRDLDGVSYGVGSSILSGYGVAERAALGRTAESHPTSGDDLVEFGFLQSSTAVVLRADEYITTAERGIERGAFQTGPLWEMIVGDAGFTLEMVYQQGVSGSDGHRLSVTGPDGAGTICESWDDVMAWARDLVHTQELAGAGPVGLALVQERDATRPTTLRERAMAAPPAPLWREGPVESDEQVAERLSGLGEFAELATLVHIEGHRWTQVWMDGRFIGRIFDINENFPNFTALWEATPVFGYSADRLTRFKSQTGGVADLAVQALRTGPPDLSRIDEHMANSFRADLLHPEPLPGVPAAGQEEGADARRTALVHHLRDLGEGRTVSGDIAQDLAVAHDELAWLLDTYEQGTGPWKELNSRIDAAAAYLDALHPDDPRARHHRQTLTGPLSADPAPSQPELFANDAGLAADSSPASVPLSAPAEPAADKAGSAAADITEGTTMATPANTEPKSAPPGVPQRHFFPGRAMEMDPQYVLHTAGPPGQDANYGELRHGDITVATLSATTGAWPWWEARVGNTVTPQVNGPQLAAADALMVAAFDAGQTFGSTPPFPAEEALSRSDRMRAEVERYVGASLTRLNLASASMGQADSQDSPEFQRLTALLTRTGQWAAPDSPASTPNGALRLAEDLGTLRDTAAQWRSTLDDEARPFMDFALVQLASEADHLQGRIRATVEEVRSERSGVHLEDPAVRQAQQPAVPADDVLDAPAAKQPAPEPEQQQDSAVRRRELPLWTGNELPNGKWERKGDVLYEPSDGNAIWRLKTSPDQAPDAPEVDWSDFDDVRQAWHDHVPYDGSGPDEDVLAAVRGDLRQFEETCAPLASSTVASDPAEDTMEAAEAVNTALDAVDTHAGALRTSPEWQKIQTIRGAARHLWDTIRERAGAHWPALSADSRFKDFWKNVSIRVCDTIARLATAAADRLRDGRSELPTAEALLNLGDAAITYSEKSQPRSVDDLDGASRDSLREESRDIRRSLRTGASLPYRSQADAVEATRDVAGAFRTWAATPMGRQLAQSDHPHVAAFRDAWQKLPPNDLSTGPGPAAGPYGDVAERAKTVVRAAVSAGRFAPDDIDALRLVVGTAGTHSARLARTLPNAAATAARPSNQQQAAVAPRPRFAQPVPAPAGRSSRI